MFTKEFIRDLYTLDSQLIPYFSNRLKRYVIVRMPEKYGRPYDTYVHGKRREWEEWEIERQIKAGRMSIVLILESPNKNFIEPGNWVIYYLKERDSRNIDVKQWLREMDEHNEKIKRNMEKEASDRISYRVGEDFEDIRDELRGEPKYHKYTVPDKE